jgi:signal transduction histidine kinase
MQKQFINIAANELKTPTQGILGFSDLLKRYPEKRQELTEAICRNATRLQRLISDILDVTKIESQNLKLEKEQLNLYDLLTDIVNDYKSQIGTKVEKNPKMSCENNYSWKGDSVGYRALHQWVNIQNAPVDEFQVKAINLMYNYEADRFYCLLEAPNKQAIKITITNMALSVNGLQK